MGGKPIHFRFSDAGGKLQCSSVRGANRSLKNTLCSSAIEFRLY
jgi:hypothetical protein